jgi:antitoxin component YwqK of YwqJK toxin-antitoxin module/DNA-directed RNA polymerase subunit RPC12/RpoP
MTCIDCINTGHITTCPTCSTNFGANKRSRCRYQEKIIGQHTIVCKHCGYKKLDSDDTHKICPEYENRKVSQTFGNGATEYYEGIRNKETLVRTEYDKTHERHGIIRYYENGKHARTEFDKTHERHGQICYFENGKHARTEFDKMHKFRGQIRYYENGKHARTEFDETHKLHGLIGYFENGKSVRTEFDKTHKRHGEICYFENGKHARTEFDKPHERHGQICYFENDKHARTEFDKMHKFRGEIRYIENGKHARTEFDKTHERHGQICYFENGKHVRTEYDETHEDHGVRTEFDKYDETHVNTTSSVVACQNTNAGRHKVNIVYCTASSGSTIGCQNELPALLGHGQKEKVAKCANASCLWFDVKQIFDKNNQFLRFCTVQRGEYKCGDCGQSKKPVDGVPHWRACLKSHPARSLSAHGTSLGHLIEAANIQIAEDDQHL